MINAECYSLMKRVFYEQEVYLLLDLTKLNPAQPQYLSQFWHILRV